MWTPSKASNVFFAEAEAFAHRTVLTPNSGNEEDHIIISVVRTEKIGFLANRRRSNVMLSRCKQSMYICTNRGYLSNKAKSTLLGELAQQWGPKAWTKWRELKA